MDIFFLHCSDCTTNGRPDRIVVLMIDKKSIHIVCENHEQPKPVYSFTIPEDERPQATFCLACSKETQH